jgi:hypothetical protein
MEWQTLFGIIFGILLFFCIPIYIYATMFIGSKIISLSKRYKRVAFFFWFFVLYLVVVILLR